MSTRNTPMIPFFYRRLKRLLNLPPDLTGAMINPQWLKLPMSRIYFHGPKDVQAIEVWLYIDAIIR